MTAAAFERNKLIGLALIVGPMLVAVVLLLIGLGGFGLATRGEIAVLDRTLAELGVPRADLERKPWLPDALRTWTFAALGRHDWALRVPGALAAVGLAGLTGLWARRLGWTSGRSVFTSLLPPLIALSLPLLVVGARTTLGDPIGEFFISAAPLALLEAGDQQRSRTRRLVFAALGLALLGCAIAARGIVVGGALPVLIVALADSGQPRVRALWWASAGAMATTGLWLGWNQAEGYIPLLAAAKDLGRIEDPTSVDFTESLLAFGYQTFPFGGLILVGGLVAGRMRLAALWLASALVVGSVWSLVYGPGPAPVCVPSALLAAAAIDRMCDGSEPIAARRLVLLVGVLGALILGKDAERTPQLIAWPLVHLPLLEFPGARLEAGERLAALADRLIWALILAHALALPSPDQLRLRERRAARGWARWWTPIESALDRMFTRANQRSGLEWWRRRLPPIVLCVAALGQAWSYGRLLGDVGEQMSIAAPLRRWNQGVEDGAIPDGRLGLHRIRDPGLEFYGPGDEREVFLTNRGQLDEWLFADEHRTALIRRSDLAASFSTARGQKKPFHVLDDRHWDYVLVANFVPEGGHDENPLLDIVLDEAPVLANQTRVGWDYVDLIGWELEGELHRGATATLHMVFEVRRPLPTGTKMYARMQQGKLSRIAAEPHDLTGGVYPPNYWRAGDFIHHRFEFRVPSVEVAWGEHELIVGLRRSEKANLPIKVPEGAEGEFGVRITGSKHEFAVIGLVEVAW